MSFICEGCGKTIEDGNDPEADEAKAVAEAKANWNVDNPAQDPRMSKVCDTCYRNIMTWYRAQISSGSMEPWKG